MFCLYSKGTYPIEMPGLFRVETSGRPTARIRILRFCELLRFQRPRLSTKKRSFMNATSVRNLRVAPFRSPYNRTFQSFVPVSWLSTQAISQPDFTQTGILFETRNLLLKYKYIIAQMFFICQHCGQYPAAH